MIAGSASAIAEINARGGVGGRRLEQIVVDVDPGDEASVRNALESLVAQEVDVITGGWVYPEQVALDAVAPSGCPYLNAFTSEYVAALVRNDPSRYRSVFQVCATEAGYGPGFVRSLDTLVAHGGWQPRSRRLLFIEQPLQSARMATAQTLAAAERSGWQVEGVHSIPTSVTRWDAVLARIRACDPAAVMLTHWGARGGSCIPAAVRRRSHRRARVPRVLAVDPGLPRARRDGSRGCAVVDRHRFVRRCEPHRVHGAVSSVRSAVGRGGRTQESPTTRCTCWQERGRA